MSAAKRAAKRVKAALPTAANKRKSAWQTIILYRLGAPVPRGTLKAAEIHDDLRVTNLDVVRRIRSQMDTDGASLDQAAAYVDEFLANI